MDALKIFPGHEHLGEVSRGGLGIFKFGTCPFEGRRACARVSRHEDRFVGHSDTVVVVQRRTTGYRGV